MFTSYAVDIRPYLYYLYNLYGSSQPGVGAKTTVRGAKNIRYFSRTRGSTSFNVILPGTRPTLEGIEGSKSVISHPARRESSRRIYITNIRS